MSKDKKKTKRHKAKDSQDRTITTIFNDPVREISIGHNLDNSLYFMLFSNGLYIKIKQKKLIGSKRHQKESFMEFALDKIGTNELIKMLTLK